MSKMFMNVKEVMEVLEVSESYAYKLMKRLNRELQAMGCQTIEYSNAIVHAFQGFRAPFSGKIVHIFPEQSAAFN